MRKCALLFLLLIAAILLFKMNASSSNEVLEASTSEELISLPENDIAKN
ncbi:hypothetical protein [uncultured Croceitalea sp.]